MFHSSGPSTSTTSPVDTISAQLKQLHLMDEATGGYLYLDPGCTGYAISMAPINSSGDIYHVLAYIIIAKHYEKDVPPVYLVYDGKAEFQSVENKTNVFTQVQRSVDFAKQLGFEEAFKAPGGISVNGTRQNARQDGLQKYLSGLDSVQHYIDQKGLTTLIAYHFMRHGFVKTTDILRQGFSRRANYLGDIYKVIDAQVGDVIRSIANSNKEKKRIVILHIRYSSKANSQQNIDEVLLQRLEAYLSREYFVWFIFTDARRSSFLKITDTQRTDPFPHYIGQEDYGKLFHLNLLIKLQALSALVGIIGNTSGTLDMAAFLGHRVYNLHDFGNQVNYQACRIIIQTTFLSVVDFRASDLINNIRTATQVVGEMTRRHVEDGFPHLHDWLQMPYNPLMLHSEFLINQQLSDAKITQAGFWELFYVMQFGNQTTLHPLLGNAVIMKQMIDNKLAQAEKSKKEKNAQENTLLALIQNFDAAHFSQSLQALGAQDVETIGQIQQTLLLFAVHASVQHAPETTQGIALIAIIVELLKQGVYMDGQKQPALVALKRHYESAAGPHAQAYQAQIATRIEVQSALS